jgi:hypothetical protein
VINGNGKTIAGVINDAMDELKDFFDTRLQMLVSEMKQKFSVWKIASLTMSAVSSSFCAHLAIDAKSAPFRSSWQVAFTTVKARL